MTRNLGTGLGMSRTPTKAGITRTIMIATAPNLGVSRAITFGPPRLETSISRERHYNNNSNNFCSKSDYFNSKMDSLG